MTAFDRLSAQLAQRQGVRDPAALAAFIGRRKLGRAAFQARARRGLVAAMQVRRSGGSGQ